jgi:hypothetical protein
MVISINLFPTWIRNFAQGKDFPQDHPVGPHIRLAGKDFIRQGFDGHPLYWHQLLSLNQPISNYLINNV